MEFLEQNSPIIKKAVDFAKYEYKKNDSFHGWSHIENVAKRASEIIDLLDEKINLELLILAIIFHDIDYNSEENFEKNYKNHVDNSVKVAENFLRKNNFPEDDIKEVVEVMINHSTPHRRKYGEAKKIEGKIIYDADKSIFITTPELYKKYFPQLYLKETKQLVKLSI